MDKASDSKLVCFVVGPIGETGSEVRKHADFVFDGIISEALDQSAGNFIKRRADRISQPGMITEQIINDLIECDLVIADLTQSNPNVYYEIGIRHSVSKPIIHIAEAGTRIPFDNFGHRVIFFDRSEWSNIVSTRRDIAAQIDAILLPDFRVSNPVTQARTLVEFKASSDSEKQQLAVLMDRVSKIENEASINSNHMDDNPDAIRAIEIRDRRSEILRYIGGILTSEETERLRTQIQNYTNEYARDDYKYSYFKTLKKKGEYEMMKREIEEHLPF